MAHKKRPRHQPVPPLPDHRLMEQTMQQFTRLLASQEIDSFEDAQAIIQQHLTSSELPDVRPTTPLEQAQEVIYQAWEAGDRQRQVALARQALTLSPDCADAYVILAETARDPHEAKALYEQGLQAGERTLGPAIFREDVGHFWGLLETRPYMRARQGLAEVLWFLGERQQAIGHYQELLRLNPNDNQGARYSLVHWLLAEGQDAALERLLDQYPQEASATWAYTRALARYVREGTSPTAMALLERALLVNPYVPDYLLGWTPLPQELPDTIEFGEENEAVEYVMSAGEIWLNAPGAVDWLAETSAIF